MDCSLPDSFVHRIFQARIQEWVAISYSRGSSNPGIEPMSLVSPVLEVGSFSLCHLKRLITLQETRTICVGKWGGRVAGGIREFYWPCNFSVHLKLYPKKVY